MSDADEIKIAFGRALLSEYDWEGATPPLGRWPRNMDLPRFYCSRCDRPVSWEENKTPCSSCEPLRILLRDAIAVARTAQTAAP
jgi:hypothetical protein